jgi:hypothetical protein
MSETSPRDAADTEKEGIKENDIAKNQCKCQAEPKKSSQKQIKTNLG